MPEEEDDAYNFSTHYVRYNFVLLGFVVVYMLNRLLDCPVCVMYQFVSGMT